MQQVKIKNINKSLLDKPFVVKGRVRFCEILPRSKKKVKQCNAIIFDNISEIEVIAFENCENYAKELPKDTVVMIENGKIKKMNKNYKRTKHKYRLTLRNNSKVTLIDNDKVNISDFPLHKYTSGPDLKTLRSGMIIDVIGVCTQIDSEKSVNCQQKIIRKANILVDSIPVEVKFFGDKVDELYNVGCTLFLHNVKLINCLGLYLFVGDSSSVQFNTQQLSNGIDTKQLQQLETVKTFCQDSTIELPDQKPSISSIIQSNNDSTIELPDQKPLTSSIIQSNNNSTIELPDQKPSISSIIQSNNISDLVDESIDERPSTSGSTPSNKRKTHDFLVEEVTSKIQKKTEPGEAFSDERFGNMVINFMQLVNNNKLVKQMQILEFVSNIVKEDEK